MLQKKAEINGSPECLNLKKLQLKKLQRRSFFVVKKVAFWLAMCQ